jgi:predicted phosphodiesterase
MKIGFIADVHEDILSLREAFRILDTFKPDAIVCLGDIVGFQVPLYPYHESRNSSECIDMIKQRCTHVVAGNHDLYAIRKAPDYPAGFHYPPNWYDMEYDERVELSDGMVYTYEESELSPLLRSQDVAYLRSLPEYIIAEFDSYRFLFSHFLFPDMSGSTTFLPEKVRDLTQHFDFMQKNDCLLSFSGHGHVEGFTYGNENRLVFNSFGTYKMKKKLKWIVGPCVAHENRSNGVLLFDTKTFDMEVIPLRFPRFRYESKHNFE